MTKPEPAPLLPPSSSEAQSEATIDVAQPVTPLTTEGRTTPADSQSIPDFEDLLSPIRMLENSSFGSYALWNSYNADIPSKIDGMVMQAYTSDEDM